MTRIKSTDKAKNQATAVARPTRSGRHGTSALVGYSTAAQSVLRLQRSAGNQFVQRMLGHRSSGGERTGTDGLGTTRSIQINQPGDSFEQEANRIADEVTNRSMLTSSYPVATTPAPGVNTSPTTPPASGKRCLQVPIQKKELRAAESTLDSSKLLMRTLQCRNGRALDGSICQFMESRLGYDFSAVRVHTDAKAAAGARAINARAYTSGLDIVFGSGEYAPATDEGRRLLAHELVHVAQQGAAAARPANTASPKTSESLRRSSTNGANLGGPARVQRQSEGETAESTPPPSTEEMSPRMRKVLRGEASPAEKETLRKDLLSGRLSEADQHALEAYATYLIFTGQVPHKGAMRIQIHQDPSNVHTFFKVGLQMRVSGMVDLFASGLQGSVETILEMNTDNEKREVNAILKPPEGDTSLAASIRATAFPNGALKFKWGKFAFKAINSAKLTGELHITVVGPNEPADGNFIVQSDGLPKGVVLLLKLSQSNEPPTLAPRTGSSALPAPRAFATAGPTFSPGGVAATLGLDLPLATDDKNPWSYMGVGARASADTRGLFAGGGALSLGYHLSPLTLAAAGEAGLAKPGRAGTDPSTKSSPFFGLEATAAYQVSKRLQVIALASAISGKDLPFTENLQLGTAITF
jgi:uncharacterized protein DUF4157